MNLFIDFFYKKTVIKYTANIYQEDSQTYPSRKQDIFSWNRNLYRRKELSLYSNMHSKVVIVIIKHITKITNTEVRFWTIHFRNCKRNRLHLTTLDYLPIPKIFRILQ